MERTQKFQDLEINNKYKVIARKEINSKYGKTYILQIIDDSENEIEIFSTKYLTTYIDVEKPRGPFQFTVAGDNNTKYVKIENYTSGFIPF
jgi:hypothetical protein